MSSKLDPLVVKARALLKRRAMAPGIGYYWRTQWKRQLLFLLLYLGISVALFALDWQIAAAIFLGFTLGRTLRDVRWYQMLAREWPSNAELLDWDKINRLAAQGTEGSRLTAARQPLVRGGRR